MKNPVLNNKLEAKEWVDNYNNNSEPLVTNETTYNSTAILVGSKTVFIVTVAKGKYNNVNVRKATNNPYGGLGKEFGSIDEAMESYKNKDLKIGLLKIKSGISQ